MSFDPNTPYKMIKKSGKARTLVKPAVALMAFLVVLCGAPLNSEAQDNRNVPPRVEIGGVMSAATQSDITTHFHAGGGGRGTFNITKYLAGEAEATHQPTDYGGPSEVHIFLAAKATYRAEQRRWLKFAGINLFGVAGPAFVNRFVSVTAFSGAADQRQTASMVEWGGGFEVVPARKLAVRFDSTHASFTNQVESLQVDQHRTYLKLAVMLRLP
jgi:hypothetical protein